MVILVVSGVLQAGAEHHAWVMQRAFVALFDKDLKLRLTIEPEEYYDYYESIYTAVKSDPRC